MSTVLKFHRPRFRGPSDILANLASLLSRVEDLQIETTEDLHHAIFSLDLANQCIRLLIRQIGIGTTREHLLAQSARINQLLETARSDAANL